MLNVTQPAVTKMLQSAEAQLGFRLFLREKNRLIPTAEAVAIQPDILDLVQQIRKLKDKSRSLIGTQSGSLRIDCVPSISAVLAPSVLRRFVERYPDFRCHIETQSYDAIVDRLLSGQADIGFVLASRPNPALIEESIAEGGAVCVAPIGTFSSSKLTVNWQDLRRCRLIMPPHDLMGKAIRSAAETAGAPMAGAVSIETNALAMKLAEQGGGVAVIDSFTAAFADPSKVQRLVLEPHLPFVLKMLRKHLQCVSHPALQFKQLMSEAARCGVFPTY